MQDWVAELREGRSESAWDLFITRYRKLIFAAIHRYARDYDDVMDVFARVCEALREDDLRRLRSWAELPARPARFSTWLVTVVHHLTIDWFRHRDGRRRLSGLTENLSPVQRRIFEIVFLEQRSHVEAFELIRSTASPPLSFRQFLVELRATYHAVAAGRRGGILRELGSLPGADPADGDPPDLDGARRREVLERALCALHPEDKVMLELYILEELPAADIARMLGLANAKAVYNRVYRSLAAVRDWLARNGLQREDL